MRRRRWYFPTVEVPRDAQEGVEDRSLRERGLGGQDILELPTTVEMTLTISLRCNSRGMCWAYLGGIYGNHFLFKGFLCGVPSSRVVLCHGVSCYVVSCCVIPCGVVLWRYYPNAKVGMVLHTRTCKVGGLCVEVHVGRILVCIWYG